MCARRRELRSSMTSSNNTSVRLPMATLHLRTLSSNVPIVTRKILNKFRDFRHDVDVFTFEFLSDFEKEFSINNEGKFDHSSAKAAENAGGALPNTKDIEPDFVKPNEKNQQILKEKNQDKKAEEEAEL